MEDHWKSKARVVLRTSKHIPAGQGHPPIIAVSYVNQKLRLKSDVKSEVNPRLLGLASM